MHNSRAQILKDTDISGVTVFEKGTLQIKIIREEYYF